MGAYGEVEVISLKARMQPMKQLKLVGTATWDSRSKARFKLSCCTRGKAIPSSTGEIPRLGPASTSKTTELSRLSFTPYGKHRSTNFPTVSTTC